MTKKPKGMRPSKDSLVSVVSGGCTEEEMMQMLGGVSQSTLARYQALPQAKLSRRWSASVTSWASTNPYPTAERANRRIRLETSEAPFAGTSVLNFMTQGSMKHLVETRRYFDAKRAG